MLQLRRTVLGALTVAVVAGCGRSPEKRAEYFADKIENRLNLNTQQKSELHKLKTEALADIEGLKEEKNAVLSEIQKQLESGKLDRDKLKKLAAAENAKRLPIADKWIDNVVTFHEGLNDKQKNQVVKDIKSLGVPLSFD